MIRAKCHVLGHRDLDLHGPKESFASACQPNGKGWIRYIILKLTGLNAAERFTVRCPVGWGGR